MSYNFFYYCRAHKIQVFIISSNIIAAFVQFYLHHFIGFFNIGAAIICLLFFIKFYPQWKNRKVEEVKDKLTGQSKEDELNSILDIYGIK